MFAKTGNNIIAGVHTSDSTNLRNGGGLFLKKHSLSGLTGANG